jgi:hypothetical membrane protein
MGTPQGLPGRAQRAHTAFCYLVLLVLGVMLGLIGSFQYSQGPVPLVAILLDLAVFLACLLGGWGMRSYAGGIVPAIGWFVASFVLSMSRANGSVIITATAAGEWFLYGGALAAAAGAAASFVLWSRARIRRR